MSTSRLAYIDNLRIFLTALVVLHHLSITYGAPGDWFYVEDKLDGLVQIPMAMFVATNQAFFMGMFFFISAFFLESSWHKKGTGRFVVDRLLRLGIPMLAFFFLLHPLTVLWASRADRPDWTFWQVASDHHYWDFGPMWFVEALLYFTLLFVLFSRKKEAGHKHRAIPAPSDRQLIAFALLLGGITFVVRLWWAVGDWAPLVSFQLGHFPQYIALFLLGVVARRQNWLDQLTYLRGRNWFLVAQALIFVAFPAIFLLGGLDTEPFMGGWHWQSLAYALWEQLTAIALIVGLLGIFRARLNEQGRLSRQLSAAAYTVYIIHAPLLVWIATRLVDLSIYPPLKFLLLALPVLAVCFGIAHFVRQLPLLRRIL